MRSQQSAAPPRNPGGIGTGTLQTRQFIWFAVTVLFAIAASPGHAQVVTEPTSLSPGDMYRLAFVSSTTRDATSSDITAYNNFVDALGDTAIASDWKAIASTGAIDARDHTDTRPTAADPPGTPGVPIFLLNDTWLADSNNDL